MIKISKNLALEMIINGKNLGSTLGKLNNGTPVNIYKREYQKDIYEIAENEDEIFGDRYYSDRIYFAKKKDSAYDKALLFIENMI